MSCSWSTRKNTNRRDSVLLRAMTPPQNKSKAPAINGLRTCALKKVEVETSIAWAQQCCAPTRMAEAIQDGHGCPVPLRWCARFLVAGRAG
jgi:hypothetical protein